MWRRNALVGISIGLASACGSFETESNGPTPDAGSSQDGGPTASPKDGGGGDSDATTPKPIDGGSPIDAGADSGANLLVGHNGNFEDEAFTSCGEWTASLDDEPVILSPTRVTMRHGGSYACKVCLTTASKSFTVYSPEVTVPEGTYHASVWVHRDGTSTVPVDADPFLQMNQSGALNGHTGFSSPNVWWERTGDSTVPPNLAPAGLRIAIRFDNATGGTSMAASTCIYVDDAVITKVQ